MRLYFLRHGLADRVAWSGSDFDRPLTPEGVLRMEASARTMARLDLGVDRVVTSPLLRARQTADIAAAGLDATDLLVEDPRLGLGFGPGALEEIVAEHADCARIMLVGHEPGFSLTIGAVTGGSVEVKKGSLVRVDVERIGPVRGRLVWMIPPKVLVLSFDFRGPSRSLWG